MDISFHFSTHLSITTRPSMVSTSFTGPLTVIMTVTIRRTWWRVSICLSDTFETCLWLKGLPFIERQDIERQGVCVWKQQCNMLLSLGDRYWHSITDLQPETAYDIKMQCFNEGGESEFGNVVILETKARRNPRPQPPETASLAPVHPGGPVPRPSDLPYLIVGVVLGAIVFVIVAFIPFCLWRVWAKQSEFQGIFFSYC